MPFQSRYRPPYSQSWAEKPWAEFIETKKSRSLFFRSILLRGPLKRGHLMLYTKAIYCASIRRVVARRVIAALRSPRSSYVREEGARFTYNKCISRTTNWLLYCMIYHLYNHHWPLFVYHLARGLRGGGGIICPPQVSGKKFLPVGGSGINLDTASYTRVLDIDRAPRGGVRDRRTD